MATLKVLLPAFLLVLGCEGVVSTPSSSPRAPISDRPPPMLPDDVNLDIWPDLANDEVRAMHRLTRLEYNRTLSDLLGEEVTAGDGFPSEETIHGFPSDPDMTFPPTLAEQALGAAEGIAGTIEVSAFANCSGEDEACAREFAIGFGQAAWRRPLSDDELADLMDVYAASSEGFARGIEMIATAVLIAPQFFYLLELGGEAGPEGFVKPTSWEMASRLSYLYWGTMPDASLVSAAEADELIDPIAILAQAERMVDDPRTKAHFGEFYDAWLHLGEIRSLNKDPEVYPDWDVEIPTHMRAEIDMFLDDMVWSDGARFPALFTATHSFVNESLSGIYGVDVRGADLVRTELDAATRQGILTRSGILALEGFEQTSPVGRGKYVRTQFFCDEVPEPPPDVDDTPPMLTDANTTRQRYEQLTGGGSCAGCHTLMNPIGYGFEAYDATGTFRMTDGGEPVDDSGEVVMTEVGAFRGAAELQTAMADNLQVRACFGRQLFRFAYNRRDSVREFASLATLDQALADSDGEFRAALVALATTNAFLYLPEGE
ncbi:MAG: DUF1592 domain-containing protein [Myxococcota bacterium]